MKNWTYQYLVHLLPILKSKIEGGAGQLHLTKPFIQAIGIPVPPKKERDKLAKALKSVDELISSRSKRKADYVKLKKALMQDLLTGKVRVPPDPE